MPRLNLRDDELEGESNPLEPDKMSSPPPTLRDVGGSSGHSSPLLLILIIIVALAGGVFLLNQFKVIHLWGKRAPKVTETIPEPGLPGEETSTESGSLPEPVAEQPSSVGEEPAAVTPTPTPTPEVEQPAPKLKPAEQKTPKATLPASTGGKFTVQVSAWTSKAKADEEVSKLSAAGMDAFVEETNIDGVEWYRVRVGHYGNEKDAKEAATQLQKSMEGVIWVARAK